MKVIVTLEDSVFGNAKRVYEYPSLKRRAAIVRAVNELRDGENSLRMMKVTSIRTQRD